MISADALRELLEYCPVTGVLTWKRGKGRARKGDVAGHVAKDTRGGTLYSWIQIRINNRLYPAHRLAWLHHYGEFPNGEVDHKNQDATDNRIDNLRDVPHQQNSKNQRMRSTNKSGVTGVYWDERTKKWRAEVKVNGQKNSLGRFDDIMEAAKVVQAFRASMGFTSLHGMQKRPQEA